MFHSGPIEILSTPANTTSSGVPNTAAGYWSTRYAPEREHHRHRPGISSRPERIGSDARPCSSVGGGGSAIWDPSVGQTDKGTQLPATAPGIPNAQKPPAWEKPCSQAFRQARQAAGFGEYALHDYAKQIGHSYLGDHLDSLVVQAVATRAYQAVNQYLLGKKGKPRFKGRNQFDSVEGKANTSGLRCKDNRVVWNIRSGKAPTLVPILPAKDEVIQHGLASRVKDVRIVRRKAESAGGVVHAHDQTQSGMPVWCG